MSGATGNRSGEQMVMGTAEPVVNGFWDIRLRDTRGVWYGEYLELDPGESYTEICRVLYSRADGAIPPVSEIGDRMWKRCRELRALWDRLHARLEAADKATAVNTADDLRDVRGAGLRNSTNHLSAVTMQ